MVYYKRMYPDPNQNQQPTQPAPPSSVPPSQPQYSIDYLNQIAPAPQKKGLSNRLFLMIAVGGGALAVIVGVLMLLSGGGSGPTQKMQTFAARVQTLEKLTTGAQKNIKSNDLRASNSNLSIFLANTDQGMVSPLEKNGVSITKLDKTIVAAENGDALTAKLEDARLNAVFDRTYAREMSYQLTALETLMKSIYSGTKSKSMKDFLQTTDDSLVPIKKQFDTFNATSS
jgi:outer membrane murein-binding lipoprotein Lpp